MTTTPPPPPLLLTPGAVRVQGVQAGFNPAQWVSVATQALSQANSGIRSTGMGNTACDDVLGEALFIGDCLPSLLSALALQAVEDSTRRTNIHPGDNVLSASCAAFDELITARQDILSAHAAIGRAHHLLTPTRAGSKQANGQGEGGERA